MIGYLWLSAVRRCAAKPQWWSQAPFAQQSTLVVSEAPRPPKNIQGQSLNRAFKSWQGPADFLLQFGHNEGWVYSMLDGLGAVAQAVAYLGCYNAVCVEKDPVIWAAACENLAKWIVDLDAKVSFYSYKDEHDTLVGRGEGEGGAEGGGRRRGL